MEGFLIYVPANQTFSLNQLPPFQRPVLLLCMHKRTGRKSLGGGPTQSPLSASNFARLRAKICPKGAYFFKFLQSWGVPPPPRPLPAPRLLRLCVHTCLCFIFTHTTYFLLQETAYKKLNFQIAKKSRNFSTGKI